MTYFTAPLCLKLNNLNINSAICKILQQSANQITKLLLNFKGIKIKQKGYKLSNKNSMKSRNLFAVLAFAVLSFAV